MLKEIGWDIINYNICSFLNIEEQLNLTFTCKRNYNNIEIDLSSLKKIYYTRKKIDTSFIGLEYFYNIIMINKLYILIQSNKNKKTKHDYNIKVSNLKTKKYMVLNDYFICYYDHCIYIYNFEECGQTLYFGLSDGFYYEKYFDEVDIYTFPFEVFGQIDVNIIEPIIRYIVY